VSDPRRPHLYQCPYIETCVFPVEEDYYKTYCREYSQVAKNPEYEKCQGYVEMSKLPRNWHKRTYQQTENIGQSKARFRV